MGSIEFKITAALLGLGILGGILMGVGICMIVGAAWGCIWFGALLIVVPVLLSALINAKG